PGDSAVTVLPTSPAWQFVLAIALGYGAFWLMLWGRHKADLAARHIEYLEHAGVRREALFLAVVLSVVWCLMAALTPQLPPTGPVRLAGASSGVWLAALTALTLSVQWWRNRTLWKVR
ncbi:MAG: hypothetical protein ACREO3_04315, partial [Arenimonas sp.]